MLIGDLKYSYAFSRKDSVFQKEYINRHDFNIGGFKTNPGGELELGLSFIDKPSSVEDANSGWAVTLQHVQEEFLGGINKLAVQYGQGPGTGLGYTGDVGFLTMPDGRRIAVVFFARGGSNRPAVISTAARAVYDAFGGGGPRHGLAQAAWRSTDDAAQSAPASACALGGRPVMADC